MLKFLRNKKTAKKVWIGLAIIIIPAFTLWGFGSSSRSREENTSAGKIFGKSVSNTEFRKSLDATRTAAIMQFGDNFPKVEKYLNLDAQAWERLILLHEARKRKLNVSDQEVIGAIQKTPYFQRNSVFDNKTYVEILRYVFRVQPRAFEEQLRQNLILAKLYDQVTNGVKIEDSQIRQEWLKTNEELSIYYISSLFAEFAKKIKPGDKEISEYYDKNKDTFREPSSINLEYILTESDAEAKKITDLIDKKYDIAKISKEINLPMKETGLFKQSTPPPALKMPQETLSQVLNLKEGMPAPVAKIDKAYYAYALKEKKPGRVAELSEVKDAIKEMLISEESRKMAQEKIKECAEKLKNRPFNKVASASAYGFKTGQTKFFKSTDQLDPLGPAQLFWETAKKLKENQVSEIFSNANGYHIIKLKAAKPVDEDKFTKDKKELGDNILNREKSKIFAKFAEEMKKKAQ
ncbi:MAG: SurA N-terminal domain-containing protein [Candidatus Omnitrophica bacterium]|nr:SurA N-terminal domain-containing protein [Candidatus Omnitrophota bacterium]